MEFIIQVCKMKIKRRTLRKIRCFTCVGYSPAKSEDEGVILYF